MSYVFYGHDGLTVVATTEVKGIKTVYDLYDVLSSVWCADTCAPRMRGDWSEENKTLGQCSITAFLVQDIFGGIVRGIPLGDGNYHCYNIVNGEVFDLTSEQFLPEVLTYSEDDPIQTRETHFAKQEKKERYELLRKLVMR